MKNHRGLTFGLILVMMIAVVPLAAAAGPHGGKRHGGKSGRGFGKMIGLGMLRAANLTDAQKAEAVAIIKSHLDDIKAKMESVRQARENMAEAMHSADATEAAVLEAYTALSETQAKMVVLRFTLMKEIKGILTEEQLAGLETKRARRIERMKQKKEDRWAHFEKRLDEFAAE